MTRAECVEVRYNEIRWKLLEELRSLGIQIMETLNRFKLYAIIHGSVARGDVSDRSDVDVFLPDPPSSFTIELALERAGISVNRRVIIQATPTQVVKGYIEIDDKRCISFPLAKLRHTERDFYRFGGEADLLDIKKGFRVPGIDKRLMFIEPFSKGHIESAIIGREVEVARILGISSKTVLERKRALIRRDKIGRTGVFVERELLPNESFEMKLKKLADQNPAIRRRLRF
jgi:hypothetical protein